VNILHALLNPFRMPLGLLNHLCQKGGAQSLNQIVFADLKHLHLAQRDHAIPRRLLLAHNKCVFSNPLMWTFYAESERVKRPAFEDTFALVPSGFGLDQHSTVYSYVDLLRTYTRAKLALTLTNQVQQIAWQVLLN
jgi:hypothetical protein